MSIFDAFQQILSYTFFASTAITAGAAYLCPLVFSEKMITNLALHSKIVTFTLSALCKISFLLYYDIIKSYSSPSDSIMSLTSPSAPSSFSEPSEPSSNVSALGGARRLRGPREIGSTVASYKRSCSEIALPPM